MLMSEVVPRRRRRWLDSISGTLHILPLVQAIHLPQGQKLQLPVSLMANVSHKHFFQMANDIW